MNTSSIAAAGLCAVLTTGPARAGHDILLQWNAIMVAVIADQPPPDMNRYAAITQLAVFEAVNAVTGEYEPHLGGVARSPSASAEAGAIAAAHGVLRHYFPDRAAFLDEAQSRSLGRMVQRPGHAEGIALGEAAAARAIAARADDGSEPPAFYLPSSKRPGEWQATPDCPPLGGVYLHWRGVAPFALRRADQFRSDPPPALTSSRYARDYQEVQELGGRQSTGRPPDRAHVVQVYAALGDAALWNPVARQLVAARPGSLAANARTFALVNMALHDAGIAVMDTKYHYNFWRPESAIADGAADGNDRTEADPSFVPFLPAPCFPSYPSGHASTSHAARAVLEAIYGRRGHSIRVSTRTVPEVALKYTSLAALTSDIDDARVYGGIHFRFEQDSGADQGRQVGRYVHQRRLRPVP